MGRSVRPGGDASGIRATSAAAGLVAVAVLALLSWLGRAGDLALAVGSVALLVPVIDAVLANRSVRSTVVALAPPEIIEAGRSSAWQIAVEGTDRPVSLKVQLFGPAPETVSLDARPGLIEVPPLGRGPLPYAVIDVLARGPLGLVTAARRHVLDLSGPPLVVPAPLAHRERWPHPRAVGFGLHEGAPIGDDLFRSVRPYRRGDERRHVDWKSTARHRELMVREHDGLGVVRVRVVVDLGPQGPTAEVVAGWASWTLLEALRRGWEVELVTLDAGNLTASLQDLGRPLRRPPRLDPPTVVALTTVVDRVRSAREVGQRLARVAHGTPTVPPPAGRPLATCSVSSSGVRWS